MFSLDFSPGILPFSSFGQVATEMHAPPDVEGWITLSLTFESFDVARANMLAMGTGVEVVAPPELRHSLVGVARSVVSQYMGRDR